MLRILLVFLLISAVFPAPAPKLVIITGPDGEGLLIVEEQGEGGVTVGDGEGDADWRSVGNQPDNDRSDGDTGYDMSDGDTGYDLDRSDGDTGYDLDSLPDLTGRAAESDPLLLYPGYRDPKTLRDMAEVYDDQVLRELARIEEDKSNQTEGDVEEAREKGRTVDEAGGKERAGGRRRMVQQSRRRTSLVRKYSPVKTWLDEEARPLSVEEVQGLSVATSDRKEGARLGQEEARPEWEISRKSPDASASPDHGPDLQGRSSDWGLEEDVEQKERKVEEARTVFVGKEKEKGDKPGGYTIYKLSKITI